MTWLWTVMRPLSMPVLRVAFRIRVDGRRNVPKSGPAILASNHLSALDHVVLPAVTRRPIVNISKAEHFDRPFKAWFFRQWGVIKLKRGAGDQGAMEAAKNALRHGHLFCIYPEGTRSRDGRLHKGHTGVARLALEMRVPVIPVAMMGTFEAKPKGGKTRFFQPTAAVVGKPLDFSAHWGKQDDKAVCRQVTDEVMRAIQALSGQEYVDAYQHNPEVPSHARDHPATSDPPVTTTAAKPDAPRQTRAKRPAKAAGKGRPAAQRGKGARKP